MSADTPLPISPDSPARQRDALAGVLWMLLSCALLAGVAALGRHAALAGIPPFQVVFLRLFFAAIALSPVLAWRGPGRCGRDTSAPTWPGWCWASAP